MATLLSDTGVAYVISAKDISQEAVNSAIAGTKKIRNSTERMAKQTERDMAAFGRSVKSALTTIMALAGAAGFGAMIKQSMTTIDLLAKTSDKLGLTTEHLAGLRHAAELSGVATNTMDMALQRMTRRLAEAAQGTGEAQNAIKELGLDAQALAAMAPDRALYEIADAMQKVENQGDRVRLAFKLFDSEGVAMVNMLKDGSAGLRAAQQEAEKLGLAISRVDAKRVEEANDAFTKMKSAVSGLSNELTIKLAPAIEQVATTMTNWLTGSESELTNKINRIAELRQQIIETEYQLRSFSGESIFTGRVEFYSEVEKRLWSLRMEAKQLGAEIGSMGVSWAQSARDLNAAESAMAGATTQTQVFTFETENLGSTIPGVVMALDDYFAAIDAYGEGTEIATARTKAFTFETQNLGDTLPGVVMALESYFGALDAAEQNLASSTVINMAEIVASAEQALLNQTAEMEAKRLKIIQKAGREEKAIRRDVLDNSIILLTTLGQESEAAAVLAIAISTAADMVRAYQATIAASTLAFASQLVPGDPTSLARATAAAAAVKAWGLVNVGLIGAVGALRIGQTLSGTGSEGVNYSYDYNAGYSSSSTTGSSASEESEETTSRALVVNIHNYGYIGADPDSLARTLVPAIRKAERDGV